MLRRRTFFFLVKRFLDTGIETAVQTATTTSASDGTRTKGFNELIAFLKRRDVIDLAKSMLERLCSLSTLVHGAPTVKLVTSHANFYTTRVFLTAYMLNLYVSEVFSVIGTSEVNVIRSARAMLTDFDEVVLAVKESRSFFKVPATLCKRFNAHLARYLDDFKVWELSEKKPAWSRMRSALVPLYFSYFYRPKSNSTAPHSSNNHASDSAMIYEQITELRAKALENYGQAVLDEFDAELRAGMFGMPPISCTKQLKEGALDTDPKFFVLKDMDQIQMVQELYLDVYHRTTPDGLKESPIHVYITKDDFMHWSVIFCELLSFPVVFTTLRHTLSELKKQLLAIVDSGRKPWVNEAIDLRLLHSSGWQECVDIIQAIMRVIKRVQIPIRDKETDEGWRAFEWIIETPEAMVEALKFIRGCLKTAECDIHSMKMLLISRTLNDNGCMYIARKFQEMLDRGVITMERTQVVFLQCVAHVCVLSHSHLTGLDCLLRPVKAGNRRCRSSTQPHPRRDQEGSFHRVGKAVVWEKVPQQRAGLSRDLPARRVAAVLHAEKDAG